MRPKRLFALSALVTMLCLLSAINATLTSAQSPGASPSPSSPSPLIWSPAQRIRGFANDSDPPYLVADQNRTVHAFSSQWIGGDLAVFYNQWSLARGWTTPNDILLSPNQRQAKVLGAVLDAQGMFHVIFYGGIEQGAEIYYSRSPAASASRARSWSPPKMIAPYATKVASASLIGDDQGHLFVLYSGNRDGNGLYAVQSMDGGDTWSEVNDVFLADDSNQWVYNIKLNLDDQRRLHVVWDLFNRNGTGQANYYARLEPDYQRWTLPMVLETVKGGDYQVNETSITSYQRELFIFYNYGNPPRHWLVRSKDGGKSWSKPVSLFPSLIGDNGPTVFLVDGGNVLHIVLPNRTSDNRLVGLWHSQWTGDTWTDISTIVSGPYNSPVFQPGNPAGIVSQGNSILLTWRTDPGLTPNGVWFTYASLDVSELAVRAMSTPYATATFTLTPMRVAKAADTSTPEVRPVFNARSDTPAPSATDTSPATGILLALVPVGFLLIIIVARSIR